MILLDTHVLVHYASDDRKLGKRARAAIERALGRDELFVSALSFWDAFERDRRDLEDPAGAVAAAKSPPPPPRGTAKRSKRLRVLS